MAAPASTEELVTHPLDPLTVAELDAAIAVLRAHPDVPERVRFVTIALDEPPKARRGRASSRRRRSPRSLGGAARSGRADHARGPRRSDRRGRHRRDRGARRAGRDHRRGVHASASPPSRADPATEPRCRPAVSTDLDLVTRRGLGRRRVRRARRGRPAARVDALAWLRHDPTDNGYARPIEGLSRRRPQHDGGRRGSRITAPTPMPAGSGDYRPEADRRRRAPTSSRSRSRSPRARASRSTAPGALAEVAAPRRLHAARGAGAAHRRLRRRRPRAADPVPRLARRDGGALRRPAARAGYRKNAFDVGEYGIGLLANALELGCDCLGEIRYFDATLRDRAGRAADDRRTRSACTRRTTASSGSTPTSAPAGSRCGARAGSSSRRSSTVGNYEYGFFWYLYQDGTIQLEVKLTGIVLDVGGRARARSRATAGWSPPGCRAPNHQHFFNVRLDIRRRRRRATRSYEVEHRGRADRPGQPVRQRVPRRATLLATESRGAAAGRPARARATGRSSTRASRNARRRAGRPTSWCPGENAVPFAAPDASLAAAGRVRRPSTCG